MIHARLRLNIAGLVVVVPGFLFLLAACADEVETSNDIGPAPSTSIHPSATPYPSESPERVPAPIIFPPIIIDFLDRPSVHRVCKGDAVAELRDGVVVKVTRIAEGADVASGEPVFREDGSRFDEPTLIETAVFRRNDGVLIAGSHLCEDLPPATTTSN